MKELGENFKNTRISMGISLEEAANDIDIDQVVLENLEDGNIKVFKDILELKKTIDLYAKYLGIDREMAINEYNDYVFATTSKISLEDIKEQMKRTKAKKEKTVRSPYTLELKKEKNTSILIISGFLLLLIIILFYFLLKAKILG